MDPDKETNKIFIFGLCILFAWMIVIIICASPKLFRDILCRFCFCWIARRREARKIEEAQARMRSASRSFLTHTIAVEPSSIMLTQAFGKNFYPLTESIEEETRLATSSRLADVDADTPASSSDEPQSQQLRHLQPPPSSSPSSPIGRRQKK